MIPYVRGVPKLYPGQLNNRLQLDGTQCRSNKCIAISVSDSIEGGNVTVRMHFTARLPKLNGGFRGPMCSMAVLFQYKKHDYSSAIERC